MDLWAVAVQVTEILLTWSKTPNKQNWLAENAVGREAKADYKHFLIWHWLQIPFSLG